MYWKVGCIYFSYLLMKIGNRVLTVIEGIGAYTETLTSAHDLCLREGGTLNIDDEIENGQIFTMFRKINQVLLIMRACGTICRS